MCISWTYKKYDQKQNTTCYYHYYSKLVKQFKNILIKNWKDDKLQIKKFIYI